MTANFDSISFVVDSVVYREVFAVYGILGAIIVLQVRNCVLEQYSVYAY